MSVGGIKLSLKKKLSLLIATIIVLVMLVAGYLGYRSLTDVSRTMYTTRSQELSKTAALSVDPAQVKMIRDRVMETFNSMPDKVSTDDWGSPEFDAYLKNYEDITATKEYEEIRDRLRIVQDSNNLQAVYLVWFDVASESTIYLVDGAYVDICLPGTFDAVMYDVDHKAMHNPKGGIAADVTNTEEYGWVVAAGSPVFYEDELVAFAAAEISMNEVMKQRNQFVLIEFASLFGLAVVFIALSIVLIDRMLIRPINKLSDASEKYWSGESTSDRHEFSQLEIHTGDELETLSNSMKQMEQNINEHMTELLNMTNQLISTSKYADEMDRAANIDALTKVRNKRAYDVEVERINQEIADGKNAFGLVMIDLNYLKKINDTYGHDKGNEAIRTLCRTICQIFVHSPVFRIGGDEFVVVLQNHDYEHLEELKALFEQEMEKLKGADKPWEGVSAAVGYALFDPALDKGVEDVFERADHEMYEDKKRMKALRA
jgi:diguanylate cyclase (GGDEF)-like protein